MTLFIADAHLEALSPDRTAQFCTFLQEQARAADAVYLLGDVFEVWIGDDEVTEPAPTVIQTLRSLTDAGVAVYFLPGNRDFLIGENFATQTGVQLLPDDVVVDVYGEKVLLLHGDTLCTDDVAYQHYRAHVRSPAWRAQVLALPLTQRRAMATQLRQTSQQALSYKTDVMTDVHPATVDHMLRTQGVLCMIHGHTHRPGIHEWRLDGHVARRIVLGDWHQKGEVLRCDAEGWRLEYPMR